MTGIEPLPGAGRHQLVDASTIELDDQPALHEHREDLATRLERGRTERPLRARAVRSIRRAGPVEHRPDQSLPAFLVRHDAPYADTIRSV
jgi:hypothetical protein